MFSGLSKWTDRLDEEFLKDISTDDGRSQKIKKLRRSRQSFLIVTFVLGFIIIVFFFLGLLQSLLMFSRIGIGGIDIVFIIGFITIDSICFAGTCLGFVLNLLNFSDTDSQIKMLLLYEKSRTE